MIFQVNSHSGLRTRIVFVMCALLTGTACQSKQPVVDRSIEMSALADEIRTSLINEVLAPWYPLAVDDEFGGFLSDLDANWLPVGPQRKMVVTQARHVWMTARAAEFLPERRDEFLAMSKQGFEFLSSKMWDDSHGGFYSLVDRDGEFVVGSDGFTQGKTAYGNAFAVYGIAAYADVSGDDAALAFAKKAFRWLDEHFHDGVNGGYYQFVTREGEALRGGWGKYPAKDQNSSIHLLEALTELYHVWPDETVGKRLEEMLTIIRDTIVVEPGYLRLFFSEDWTAVSYRDSSEASRSANYEMDHVSFGHDVETAYLMLEATDALGLDRTETLRVGKMMIDHSLAYGYDSENGGLIDGSYYLNDTDDPVVVLPGKAWWPQAEALNSFLIFADLYPDDSHDYDQRFWEMWKYIDENVVDHERGGWYWAGLDVEPERKEFAKGSIWKAAYHDGRALLNVVHHLRRTGKINPND